MNKAIWIKCNKLIWNNHFAFKLSDVLHQTKNNRWVLALDFKRKEESRLHSILLNSISLNAWKHVQ